MSRPYRPAVRWSALALLVVGVMVGLVVRAAALGSSNAPRDMEVRGSKPPGLWGVNLAGNNRYIGAETWPTHQALNYYLGRGMTVFRIMTQWQNLIYSKDHVVPAGTDLTKLDAGRLAGLDETIKQITDAGRFAIIDTHNSMRFWYSDSGPQLIVGQSAITPEVFGKFWANLAEHYKANRRVIFEISNEPHDQDSAILVKSYNTVIAAIRATGARNLILIDGNTYSGVGQWFHPYDRATPNAESMLGIVDPANNFAFDVHEYFDGSGGTLPTCKSNYDVAATFPPLTQWALDNGKRLFYGESSGGPNPTCEKIVSQAFNYVNSVSPNPWIGWAYFAAMGGQIPYTKRELAWWDIDPTDFDRPAEDVRLSSMLGLARGHAAPQQRQ